jgi:hypothetical protein
VQAYLTGCSSIGRTDLRVILSIETITSTTEDRRESFRRKRLNAKVDYRLFFFESDMMQSSSRVLVASARASVLRISRQNGIRSFYSRPPPSILVSNTSVQRRGYRRSAVSLKEDDDKRGRSHKDVGNKEKQVEEHEKNKSSVDVDSPASDQDAKLAEKAVESAEKGKSVEAESTSGKEVKEKRTKESKREKQTEENTSGRPAVLSRNQALSLVANNAGKSRLIITNHDHPETYPQCMALAMSGRPILPGFYSTRPPV